MLFADPKKKPSLLTIIAGLGPKDGSEKLSSPDEPMHDNSIALKSALQEFWKAMNVHDWDNGVTALKSFVEMCQDDYDDDDEGKDEGDDEDVSEGR